LVSSTPASSPTTVTVALCSEGDPVESAACDDLVARDKVNLDLAWLRDESLEDLDNLPPPEIIAREIVEDLTAALEEFAAVAAALDPGHGAGVGGE
jgi:type I restriction enzyme M protein